MYLRTTMANRNEKMSLHEHRNRIGRDMEGMWPNLTL
jgi:hypothetical protein